MRTVLATLFIVELYSDLDEWLAPLLFQGLVRKGVYTISHSNAQMWMEERAIPSGRQNIGSILRNHKLQSYNEMALLSLSQGRCAQDHCYIVVVALEDIPEEMKERTGKNLLEYFPVMEVGLYVCFGTIQ